MVAAEHLIELVRRYGEAMHAAGVSQGSGQPADAQQEQADGLMDEIRQHLGCPDGH